MTLQSEMSSPEDCVALYERGLHGADYDPLAAAALADEIESMGGYRDAATAIYRGAMFGSGEGVLSLPYLAAMRMYPGCLPGGSQQRGDCVSWTMRSACLTSYCASLMWGDNQERYAPPSVTEGARTDGVFSTEVFYWHRGHGGEGWNGADAAKVGMTKAGLVIRQNYPEIGIDLTRYSGRLAGRWGASPPPAEVVAATSKNLLSTATVCKTWADVRDMLANGYAISTTGSEAWERTRDENGYCRRSNSKWYHALSFIAADDREEMRRKYNCRAGGLVLVQNSWGLYCGDECPIYNSPFKIPGGSFWARWDDVMDRYMVAIGGAKGFVANPVPRWSLSSLM